MRRICGVMLTIFVVAAGRAGPAVAQERAPTAPPAEVKEEVLPPILIVTVVEKPNVAILPKRIKPEFKTPLFIDRSFDRELRQLPPGVGGLQEELESAKRVRRLEELLLSKKK
ncbi:MAG: hypothetical protein ONB17_01220 [candidate division KSB1 bacterium]|nr:hypothetical protein [candidate division KSB1 bacterium]MDZ7295502.1 hypothetical protein [candidate division KSB1 bacterium]MDZ7391976.1 hypothetical protein [candidate division KSB1 bacterium]MDZ7412051.1 hypothetical protein [candidate division KSB1 bacterium]